MSEPHPLAVDPQHPLVERVRGICLAYPEAVEVGSWGRPTFRAGKKIFASLAETMDRPFSIVIKPDPAELPAYRQDPLFRVPPYWGAAGWISTDIDGDADWQLIAELIDTSYRQVALKRQLRMLDER